MLLKIALIVVALVAVFLIVAAFQPSHYRIARSLTVAAPPAIVFAQGSLLKSIGMILLGLLLGSVGADVNTCLDRFTFGVNELRDGIGIAALSMGVFGIAEVALNLARPQAGGGRAGDGSIRTGSGPTSGRHFEGIPRAGPGFTRFRCTEAVQRSGSHRPDVGHGLRHDRPDVPGGDLQF